ncbi:MAG: hydantoinase/carbamoylase family amidase [Burkholderiaceae bacterium]
MPTPNAKRLLDDLYHLRSFGASGTGVVRPSLSEIDMQARRWLVDRLNDAGLDAHIDGIGNVFGRSRNPGKKLLVGSHSDTQPTGGWLDGALGVIYALEAARALAEDPATAHLPIEVVAWIDEESTFASCLGSRTFSSMVTEAEFAAAQNDAGLSLADALSQAGLDGEATKPGPGEYLGYLEAHIEQGPHLELAAKRIGVVTAIVGSRNFSVRFTGRQNHAGTTPMPVRKDAGIALMSFGHHLNEAFQKIASDKSVWTMGRVAFSPGAASIIPGASELHLQFRDPDDAQLDRLQACAEELVRQANEKGPVQVDLEEFSPPTRPANMDAGFQEHLSAAAVEHAPDTWQAMPSAAVHDAMFVASVMPAGMMFIPSIDGVSHDFSENTADDDIVLGSQVFTSAIARILSQADT